MLKAPGKLHVRPWTVASLGVWGPLCYDTLLCLQEWAWGSGRMAVYLEFVVLGPPISNQQSTPKGKLNLTVWRATVAGQAQNQWTSPVLSGPLKAIIINFHDGNSPSVDVDNMSKPIFDVMQSIVYIDDRQIRQAQITHLEIGAPFSIVGVSKIIVNAIQAGTQFVYVRIEDPADPFPLPK